jgi:hypothetical protein
LAWVLVEAEWDQNEIVVENGGGLGRMRKERAKSKT